jgi:hypothetical protein
LAVSLLLPFGNKETGEGSLGNFRKPSRFAFDGLATRRTALRYCIG